MLYKDNTAALSMRREPTASVDTFADWQARAVAAYQRSEHEEIAALRAELAARISGFIQRPVSLEPIVVDHAARVATAVVDGVLFRLQQQDLVLIRSCAHCGIGQLASPPIAGMTDLGRALAGWEPRCAQCLPEDSTDWLCA